MPPQSPTPGQAIARGLRRKCPQCGEGRIFRGWFTMRENCSSCGLQYEGSSGDLWGFWIFTDRIFLFGAIIVLYFGFQPERWSIRALLLAAIIVPLVITMPNRQGAFVALDYLSRTRWR